jgi:RNA polymerase sigma factor (sigma-70 family)
MPAVRLSGLVDRLGPHPTDVSSADGELLARFVAARDESAFAELFRRYGPLVLAACRRVTRDGHLAEDAFQAVFVVLAANAARVRAASTLPAWLHTVATRTALRARIVADRRRRREVPVDPLPETTGRDSEPGDGTDLAAVVDEEVARLPETLREAVVLCELEGRSRRDAAARLGVPEGTISSRLAAARKVLAVRLRGRGIALGSMGLFAALGRDAKARVPAGLAARALASALSPNAIPAAVAALSTGVVRVMFAQKLKVVLVLVAGALGALVWATLAVSAPPAPTEPAPAQPTPNESPQLPARGPNTITFWRDGQMMVIDPDGKNEKAVRGDGEHSPGMGGLSPDGKKVAVLVPPDDGTPGEKQASMSLRVRVLAEKGPGTDLGLVGNSFVWSPDSTEIASTLMSGLPGAVETKTVVVNVATGKKTTLTLPAGHFVTDWARDGKLLTTRITGTKPDEMKAALCLVNRDGTAEKVLTDEKLFATFGRIAPDGTRVLFTRVPRSKDERENPPKRADLVVFDVATGKTSAVRDVPLNGFIVSFCWSPDGKRIAYVWREIHEGQPAEVFDKETESHLVVCDADGRNQKTLVSATGKGQWQITLVGVDWR